MVKLVAYSQGVNRETPEEILKRAFSECYQKEANIETVTRNLAHQSVLEHISFTFHIELSRVAWEQLVRHRIASYTAQSHRYTEPTFDDMICYIPEEVKKLGKEAEINWIADTFQEYLIYRKWRQVGLKKQDARYLLNKGVRIRATWSINLRSLLNFLQLRTKSHAQDEIRFFAEAVWQEIKPLFPHLSTPLEELFRR